MFPASQIGGDARLELPPASRIKAEQREIDGKVRPSRAMDWKHDQQAPWATGSLDVPAAALGGCIAHQVLLLFRCLPAQVYTYIAFTSETTTRSGYQVGELLLSACLAGEAAGD